MNNNSIFLYYKEFCLGSLTSKGKMFFWVPNLDNILRAKSKYPLGMEFFFLPQDKTQIFDKVPAHFDIFLASADREDIKLQSGIVDSDDDFSKLEKLSKLKYFSEDFVIKKS